MSVPPFTTALIIGAGSGLSASLARRFAKAGLRVGIAARDQTKLAALATETGGRAFSCDSARSADVTRLFSEVTDTIGEPDVVVYNASGRTRGPLIDLDPGEVERGLAVSAFGGFLVGQQAAKRMIPRGRGAILFTGASASVKGYPQSAPFAMGKFALRGLAQSMARVAHFVIDGAIRNPGRVEPADRPDSMLDPDAIAQTYFDILMQPRSAWTWEVELRPWLEKF